MKTNSDQRFWQGRGEIVDFLSDDELPFVIGNVPDVALSGPMHSESRALQVAQQIVNQYDQPGLVVVAIRALNEPISAELTFADGSTRKLMGLFAHRILSHLHED